ncbi:MAG TPA: hypothetical protein VF466_02860 [Candidatus Saccharimonadales bacterium]
MTRVITGEVAGLFTAPFEAWQGGALLTPVRQTELGVGVVTDVASLATIFAEMYSHHGRELHAAARFAEQVGAESPYRMAHHLAWLASAMSVHVVLDLGEEPLLHGLPTGSLMGKCDEDGKLSGPLCHLQQHALTDMPPHLLADGSASLTHRGMIYNAAGAGMIGVGDPVKIVPLDVTGAARPA